MPVSTWTQPEDKHVTSSNREDPNLKPSAIYRRICKPIEIKWRPRGFPIDARKGPIPRHFLFEVATEAEHTGLPSFFDVRLGNLPFTANYDPKKHDDPMQVMDEAAWQAIMEGPFAGRRFLARPREISTLEDVLDDETNDQIPVEFRCEGPRIPGLELSTTVKAVTWHFFVTMGSREYTLIEQARDLRRESRMGTRSAGERAAVLARLSQDVQTGLAAF